MSIPTVPAHVPVLLAPVLDAAAGARRVVDATLGDGGHAASLLASGIELLGIDRDPEAIARSRRRLGTPGFDTWRPRISTPRRSQRSRPSIPTSF